MVVKANNQYYLVVIPADRKIDWKLMKQILNTKEIRFATPEEAEAVTHVKMGSIPPIRKHSRTTHLFRYRYPGKRTGKFQSWKPNALYSNEIN